MKLSDYRRLGKISIQARKKSTKTTVRGISFGLIMLIPIVFFALAFYVGLTGEINKTATIACAHVPSKNVYDTSGKSVQKEVTETGNGNSWINYIGMPMLDYKTAEKFAKADGVQNVLVSEYYSIGNPNNFNASDDSASLSVAIGNEKKPIKVIKNNNNGNAGNFMERTQGIKAVNMSVSGDLISSAEKKDFSKAFGGNIFVAGGEFTKSTLGKGEIIISESIISKNDFAVAPSDAIGKKLSMEYAYSQNDKANSLGIDITVKENGKELGVQDEKTIFNLITDFTIVGVVSDNYFKLNSTNNDRKFWISTASIYFGEQNSTISPARTFTEATKDDAMGSRAANITYDYSNIAKMGEAAAKENVMFLANGVLLPSFYDYNYGSQRRYGDAVTENQVSTLNFIDTKAQLKDYNTATKFYNALSVDYNTVDLAAKNNSMGASAVCFASDTFENFTMIALVGNYLMIILFAFGGIIFFATMLNLYNTINYSVQVRKNYIGVMRAIGAKDNTIPKMYFHEIVLIFIRSTPWALIFGGALSLGVKIAIDYVFKLAASATGAVIKLNFMFFFVTLIGVVAIVFLIAFLFSRLACWSVARRPILEVLSDDKG